jgi:hypothetical protein
MRLASKSTYMMRRDRQITASHALVTLCHPYADLRTILMTTR